ncbi:hypothetical protein WP50_34225 [Lactiplantibacillus plantarum]|nr:hypothetical protein WP50_34225 [Lactiplantibacillus plantarum]
MQFRKIVPLMSGLLVMSVGLAACGHSETKTKHPTSTVAKVAKATKQTVDRFVVHLESLRCDVLLGL